jgi:DNA processing protein
LAKEQIDLIESAGGRILAQEDGEYPQGFLDLENPPLLISMTGHSSLLQKPGIAVVGTRDPSGPGRHSARRLGRECAENRQTVVSGLALGCDALAHQGALDLKGPTIAVLPSDLTRIVPGANRPLASRILSEGGLLISEVFPKTRLEPYHFVQRNRLIAALSQWILVVEAGLESGTMHTVRMGRKLNKKIGVRDPCGLACEGGRWILDHGWGVAFHQLRDLL